MKLTEIARILDATLLVGEDKLGIDITRCGASDLMSDILAGPSEGSLLLTGLTRPRGTSMEMPFKAWMPP